VYPSRYFDGHAPSEYFDGMSMVKMYLENDLTAYLIEQAIDRRTVAPARIAC
jgi:hypothetical protein